jgi:CRP/FNR family cyclic AMP-dependent transcriptional regulator
MSIYDMIKNVPLFQNFSDEEIKLFSEMDLPIKDYEKDDFIIKEGDPSTTLFLLIQGSCLITKQQGGVNIRLSKLTAGEIFGEMSWVSGKPRQSNVVAKENVTVLTMDDDFFNHLSLDMSLRIKDYLIKILIKRLDHMNEAIMKISRLMRA